MPFFAPISAASAPVSGYTDFSSSGTFTMPIGKTYAQAIIIGAGGGGTCAYAGYGSGGSGGYLTVTPLIAISPGTTCSVVIGGGGGGQTSTRNYGQYGSSGPGPSGAQLGGTGGDSSITISGTTYTAIGGAGGYDHGYGYFTGAAGVRGPASMGFYQNNNSVFANPQSYYVGAIGGYVSAGGRGKGNISGNSSNGYSTAGSSGGPGGSELSSQGTANASSPGCGGGGGENAGNGANGLVRVYYI